MVAGIVTRNDDGNVTPNYGCEYSTLTVTHARAAAKRINRICASTTLKAAVAEYTAGESDSLAGRAGFEWSRSSGTRPTINCFAPTATMRRVWAPTVRKDTIRKFGITGEQYAPDTDRVA